MIQGKVFHLPIFQKKTTRLSGCFVPVKVFQARQTPIPYRISGMVLKVLLLWHLPLAKDWSSLRFSISCGRAELAQHYLFGKFFIPSTSSGNSFLCFLAVLCHGLNFNHLLPLVAVFNSWGISLHFNLKQR